MRLQKLIAHLSFVQFMNESNEQQALQSNRIILESSKFVQTRLPSEIIYKSSELNSI